MTTRFVAARDVWSTVTKVVRQSRRNLAAIALGRGGGKMLPLRKGDTLVVDMSKGTVAHGATDPHEVAKFIRRGVLVCSRQGLHAKFVVTTQWLVSGSMNASVNSRDVLTEAAILTNEKGARELARKTIESWAVRPVTPRELKAAIENYRPPRFPAAKLPRPRKKGAQAQRVGALWIESGLVWSDEDDQSQADDRQLDRAVKGRRRRTGFDFNRIGFGRPDRFTREAKPGEWVIQIVEDEVLPPGRVVATRTYRYKGKERTVVAIEERATWTAITKATLKRGVKRVAQRSWNNRKTVVTGPDADAIMSLWSPATGKPLLAKFNGKSR